MNPEGFNDAEYAADLDDRKSVSGGVLYVNGMIVGTGLQNERKCGSIYYGSVVCCRFSGGKQAPGNT